MTTRERLPPIDGGMLYGVTIEPHPFPYGNPEQHPKPDLWPPIRSRLIELVEGIDRAANSNGLKTRISWRELQTSTDRAWFQAYTSFGVAQFNVHKSDLMTIHVWTKTKDLSQPHHKDIHLSAVDDVVLLVPLGLIILSTNA